MVDRVEILDGTFLITTFPYSKPIAHPYGTMKPKNVIVFLREGREKYEFKNGPKGSRAYSLLAKAWPIALIDQAAS